MAPRRSITVVAGLAWLGAQGGPLGCADGDGNADASATSNGTTTGSSSEGSSTNAATSSVDASVDASGSSESTASAEPWRVAFEVDEQTGALLSAWGPSAAHVYAVGGQNGPGVSTGAMLVRERGQWSELELPADTAKLNWIHGNGELRVAVGERGVILMRSGDDAATPWETFGCGTVLPLWGAWVVADDDVWTVGGDGFSHAPVLCRFDGGQWSQLELPADAVASKGLFKVFGLAPDDVWAVGDGGLLLHLGASGWQAVDSGTDVDLISLWGTARGELVAVGGRASGVLARKTEGWTIADLGESVPGLNGVWMDPSGTATVVGILGTIATLEPGGLTPAFEPAPTMSTLHAVWSPGDGTFIAVGGSLELPPPFTGVILERP
ncbi:MAG: hypothetical protein IAG13_27505 [Deltaproteobacteria bacterium]|nr:hypothetical protein [Nannocystaceae bacterium]